MSAGDLSPFGGATDTILLERARVRAAGKIGPAVEASMTLDAHRHIVDGLVVQLTAEVLRHRVGDAPETVDWHSTVRVEVPTPAPRPPCGWQPIALAGAVLAVAGTLLGSPVGAAGAIGLAVAALLLRILNPPGQPGVHEQKVPVAGTIRVQGVAWQTFPRNAMLYPPELGDPVSIVTYDADPSIWQRPEGT